MTLREQINQNPGKAAAIVAGIALLSLIVIFYQLSGRTKIALPPALPDQAFYTDDDGKTFYADDAKNLPPYQHNGKTAYRAAVYSDNNGHQWIGLLESLDPAQKKQADGLIKDGMPPRYAFPEKTALVKKPGEARWINPATATGAELEKARLVTPPEGVTGPFLRIYPGQETK